MFKNNKSILYRCKYEFLLIALLMHLFIAVFFNQLIIYTDVVWPLNMLVLGVFSVGIFTGSGRWKKLVKNGLLVMVIALPVLIVFVKVTPLLMQAINFCHIAFYAVIFLEVLKFLLKPSYINADIVSASACGYLLLIEIGIFAMQAIYYSIPNSFKGIDTTTFTTVYLDLVYFCSITLTSIGFGDITPAHHISKLATSLLGIAGQFYSVVLVGIMISKYTSGQEKKNI